METISSRMSTRAIAISALCIALLVASCLFTIPLGPVPFTLQTAVVILIALLLEPRQAGLTTGTYLLMGAIGLPVFSGLTGGIGKILGPTGGFLVSYLIGSMIAAAIRSMLVKRGVRQIVADIACAACIIVISDVMGWAWLMVVAGLNPLAAFLSAVAPFLLIDCLKAVFAIAVAKGVRTGLHLA